MEIRQQQKMEQQLALSQEMLTSLNILQLSGTELFDFLAQEAQSNPALDSDQTMGEIDRINRQVITDRLAAYQNSPFAHPEGSPDRLEPIQGAESFQEYLLEQLTWLDVSPRQLTLGRALIASLDERGYLPEDEVRILAMDPGFDDALTLIQSLEPAGIAARSLSESLILQLRRRGIRDSRLETLLTEDLAALAGADHEILSQRYPGIDVTALLELVRTLDPRPVAAFAPREPVIYILPDLTFTIDGDQISVTLNRPLIPKISISSDYLRLLEQMDGEEKLLSRNYVRRLTGIIEAMEKRNTTLLRVGQAIAHHQQELLLGRSPWLSSLTMSELAAELDLSVSTISRAVRDKYVQAGAQIHPLQSYFTRGGPRNQAMGSRGQIHGIITELIGGENPEKPFSDQRISEILGQRGIQLSRRAVTKYRLQLELPPRHQRHKKK